MSDDKKDSDSLLQPDAVLSGGAVVADSSTLQRPGMPINQVSAQELLGYARELPIERISVRAVMEPSEPMALPGMIQLKAYQLPREEVGMVTILAYGEPGVVIGHVTEIQIFLPTAGQTEHVECDANVAENQCLQLRLTFNEEALSGGEN